MCVHQNTDTQLTLKISVISVMLNVSGNNYRFLINIYASLSFVLKIVISELVVNMVTLSSEGE